MRKAILFMLLYSFCASLIAQKTPEEKAVYQLFDKPGKVKWLKHYKGRIDDRNDVSVTLAYDGKYCKGQMIYLRSNEIFGLVGVINKDEILIQELDQKQAISALMYGEIKQDKIEMEWTNIDNTVGCQMFLEEVHTAPIYPTACGNNKWINSYAGEIEGAPIEVVLQKDNGNELRGYVYFKAEEITLELKGIAHNDYFFENHIVF